MTAPIRITIEAAAGQPAATIGSTIARALRSNGYGEEDVEIVHAEGGRLLIDARSFAAVARARAEQLDSDAEQARPAVGAATKAAILRVLADVVLEAAGLAP